MSFSSFACRVARAHPLRRIGSLLSVAAPCVLAACVSPDPTNTNADSAVDSRVRDVDFQHEECTPGADSKTVDVNGDTRPDILHILKDGREVCRIVDLNFDGSVDVFIFYDDKGSERRREADFDRDGRPDQISIYQNGALTEHHRETNYDDKIDTWDYYQGGALVRRERDSDGDAIVDQWWTFYDPARPLCATVASDRNADGKPDTDSQVDLCGQGYVSPGAAPGAPAPPPGTPPATTATGAPGTPPAATATTPTPPPAAPSPAPAPTP